MKIPLLSVSYEQKPDVNQTFSLNPYLKENLMTNKKKRSFENMMGNVDNDKKYNNSTFKLVPV